jgi:hypothetical protein
MDEIREIDVGPLLAIDQFERGRASQELIDAIDLASDQDKCTWLTDKGRRIAMIIPVGDAEYWTEQGVEL